MKKYLFIGIPAGKDYPMAWASCLFNSILGIGSIGAGLYALFNQ